MAGCAAQTSLKADAARDIEQGAQIARPGQLFRADIGGRRRRRASTWANGGPVPDRPSALTSSRDGVEAGHRTCNVRHVQPIRAAKVSSNRRCDAGIIRVSEGRIACGEILHLESSSGGPAHFLRLVHTRVWPHSHAQRAGRGDTVVGASVCAGWAVRACAARLVARQYRRQRKCVIGGVRREDQR